jgi:DNA repair exonuclease SbcCD nuclease subunit
MHDRRSKSLPGLRLLHTSDCHLGKGAEIKPAFEALLAAVVAGGFDILLIVGDLFDSTHVEDNLVTLAARELSNTGVPTILLPGNHDPIGPHSVYKRFRAARPAQNIHILDEPGGTWLALPELGVTFWGRPTREHTPWFHPLADVPTPPDDSWAVLLAHGQVMPSDEPTRYSSPIYPRHLAALRWDYLALGHADRYQVISGYNTPSCYPGDTARSRQTDAGAVAVTFRPDVRDERVTFEWMRLDPSSATTEATVI